jgi:hypothetical protein
MATSGVDLTGRWRCLVRDGASGRNMASVLLLRQSGDHLGGFLRAPFGSAPIVGVLSGDVLSLEGGSGRGTIRMNGRVNAGGVVAGAFELTRRTHSGTSTAEASAPMAAARPNWPRRRNAWRQMRGRLAMLGPMGPSGWMFGCPPWVWMMGRRRGVWKGQKWSGRDRSGTFRATRWA